LKRKGEGTTFTLDRKLFSSDVWQGPPRKLKLWIYLIGSANWKEGNFNGVPIPRGCLVRSYRTIQKECDIPIGTIHRYVEELTKEGRIRVKSLEHLGTFIEVLKYRGLQRDIQSIVELSISSYNNIDTHIVNKLVLGSKLLEHQGEDAFMKYAKHEGLSDNDIDSIRRKVDV
jgi:hypothetical protein